MFKREEKTSLLNKLDELNKKLASLCDDRFHNVITVDNYMKIATTTENELASIKEKIAELEKNHNEQKKDRC